MKSEFHLRIELKLGHSISIFLDVPFFSLLNVLSISADRLENVVNFLPSFDRPTTDKKHFVHYLPLFIHRYCGCCSAVVRRERRFKVLHRLSIDPKCAKFTNNKREKNCFETLCAVWFGTRTSLEAFVAVVVQCAHVTIYIHFEASLCIESIALCLMRQFIISYLHDKEAKMA